MDNTATLPARRFIFELVNLHQFEIAPEIIADDCTYVSPANTYHGREDCMTYMHQLLEAWSHFQVSVLDIAEHAGRITAQITVEATPVKEFLGIPPSFKKISLPAVAHFQIRDGKIKMLKIDYEFARLLVRD